MFISVCGQSRISEARKCHWTCLCHICIFSWFQRNCTPTCISNKIARQTSLSDSLTLGFTRLASHPQRERYSTMNVPQGSAVVACNAPRKPTQWFPGVLQTISWQHCDICKYLYIMPCLSTSPRRNPKRALCKCIVLFPTFLCFDRAPRMVGW